MTQAGNPVSGIQQRLPTIPQTAGQSAGLPFDPSTASDAQIQSYLDTLPDDFNEFNAFREGLSVAERTALDARAALLPKNRPGVSTPDSNLALALLHGAGSGAKGLTNGVASGVVSTVSLGFAPSFEILALNDFDRAVGAGGVAVGAQLFTEVAIGVATGGAASTGSKLGKAALVFDALGNTVSVGRGAVDVFQQGGLTVGSSVQLFGGLGGGIGNFAGTRSLVDPKGVLPHGFFTADEFANFGDELLTGLRGIGIDDAQGVLQGSSVTGVRRFSKPRKGIPAGTPFDAIETSDFDVAISSPSLLRRANALRIPLRGRGTRSQPLTSSNLEALGLQNLPGSLGQRLFKSNGRDINFIITDSAETAFSRGPSIRIPTR